MFDIGEVLRLNKLKSKDVFLNQNIILNNIKFYAELINNSLKDLSFSDSPKTLYDPIKYIIEIGGKRIRPFLVLMSAESSINNKSRFNVYLTPSLIFFGIIIALILSFQNEEASVFPKFISVSFYV